MVESNQKFNSQIGTELKVLPVNQTALPNVICTVNQKAALHTLADTANDNNNHK